jgi:lipopolysaccharide transport system permease protein
LQTVDNVESEPEAGAGVEIEIETKVEAHNAFAGARARGAPTAKVRAAKLPATPVDTVQQVATYRPDNPLGHGYFGVLRAIATELWRWRWLTTQLFRRDLASFYKQSFLGVVWMLVLPLITIGSFVLLQDTGVVSVGEITAPYAVYAAVSVAIWQLFARGLVAGAGSLAGAGEMIKQVNFSRKSLVIAVMGQPLLSFIVLLAAAACLLAYYVFTGFDYAPGLGLVVFPLSLIPIAMLTLGLAFVLALVNAVSRDVSSLLSVGLMFLMLVTPILYERPAEAGGSVAREISILLSQYNPLYYLVVGPRDLLLHGRMMQVDGFLISTAVAWSVFVVGIVSFHLAEARVAERV